MQHSATHPNIHIALWHQTCQRMREPLSLFLFSSCNINFQDAKMHYWQTYDKLNFIVYHYLFRFAGVRDSWWGGLFRGVSAFSATSGSRDGFRGGSWDHSLRLVSFRSMYVLDTPPKLFGTWELLPPSSQNYEPQTLSTPVCNCTSIHQDVATIWHTWLQSVQPLILMYHTCRDALYANPVGFTISQYWSDCRVSICIRIHDSMMLCILYLTSTVLILRTLKPTSLAASANCIDLITMEGNGRREAWARSGFWRTKRIRGLDCCIGRRRPWRFAPIIFVRLLSDVDGPRFWLPSCPLNDLSTLLFS